MAIMGADHFKELNVGVHVWVELCSDKKALPGFMGLSISLWDLAGFHSLEVP